MLKKNISIFKTASKLKKNHKSLCSQKFIKKTLTVNPTIKDYYSNKNRNYKSDYEYAALRNDPQIEIHLLIKELLIGHFPFIIIIIKLYLIFSIPTFLYSLDMSKIPYIPNSRFKNARSLFNAGWNIDIEYFELILFAVKLLKFALVMPVYLIAMLVIYSIFIKLLEPFLSPDSLTQMLFKRNCKFVQILIFFKNYNALLSIILIFTLIYLLMFEYKYGLKFKT